MPRLTWQNISGSTSAGTEALKNAGSLFNRAFKQFGQIAKDVDTETQTRYDKGIKRNTEVIAADIRSAATPEELSAKLAQYTPEALEASGIGEQVDLGAISKLGAAQGVTIQEQADATTKRLRDEARFNQQQELAGYQLKEARDKAGRERFRQQTSGTLTDVNAQFDDDIGKLEHNLRAVKAQTRQAAQTGRFNPAQLNAFEKNKRKEAGISDTDIMNTLLSSDIGKDRGAVAKKALDYGIQPDRIAGLYDSLKAATGVKQAETKAAKQTEDKRKLSEKILLKNLDSSIKQSDPVYIGKLINQWATDTDFWDPDASPEAIKHVTDAMRGPSGLTGPEAMQIFFSHGLDPDDGDFQAEEYLAEVARFKGTAADDLVKDLTVRRNRAQNRSQRP